MGIGSTRRPGGNRCSRNLGGDSTREIAAEGPLGGRSSDSSSESNGRVYEVEVIRYPPGIARSHLASSALHLSSDA